MAIDLDSSHDLSFIAGGRNSEEKERMPRMKLKLKSHHRIRSSQQILVDFQEQARTAEPEMGQEGGAGDEIVVEDQDDNSFEDDVFSSPMRSFPPSPFRKEDTARKSKRFSLPAVALHATNVTARMTEGVGNVSPLSVSTDEQTGRGHMSSDVPSSPARYKRSSWVLAGGNSQNCIDEGGMGGSRINGSEDGELVKGVAAVKLTELLKKSKMVGN